MPDIPKWFPENPYPEEVFPMDAEGFKAAIPDEAMRTAAAGFVGRVTWDHCSRQIANVVDVRMGAIEAMVRIAKEALDG